MDKILGPGRFSTGSLNNSAASMAAENTILFGQAVKLGTSKEEQVKKWDGASSADIFAGIALCSVTGDLDNDQYVAGQAVPVGKKGRVFVKVSSSSVGVTAGKKVAVREDGLFDAAPLSAGSSGKYGVEIDGAQFLTNGAADEIVEIEINLPCGTKNVQL